MADILTGGGSIVFFSRSGVLVGRYEHNAVTAGKQVSEPELWSRREMAYCWSGK
jgi:hypothetical protein